MEGLTPALVLIEESEKGSDFSFKTTDEILCDWLTSCSVEESSVPSRSDKQQDKKNIVGRKERSFFSFGNVNKGLRVHNRSSLPGTCSRSHEGLYVKFEHFSFSSQFIEQYRREKELRLEAALNTLMEHERRVVRSSHEVVDSKSKSMTEVSSGSPSKSSTSTCCPELRHKDSKKFANSVKPSLPQTGYFSGKKWVYPKDMDSFNRNCATKHSKLQFKKPEIQVHKVFNVHNMFLTGTGKPINTTYKKTWTIPRKRTVCRSAPANSRRSYEKITLPASFMATSSRNVLVASPIQSEIITNCADSSCLMEGSKNHQSLEALKNAEKTVVYGEETNYKESVECANVIDFYKHRKQDTRSRAYVRIGT